MSTLKKYFYRAFLIMVVLHPLMWVDAEAMAIWCEDWDRA